MHSQFTQINTTRTIIMKQNIFLLLCLLGSQLLSAQVNTTPVAATALPNQIKYEGSLVQAVKWDAAGEQHYLVLSQKTKYPSGKNDMDGYPTHNAALFAYHVVVAGDSSKLIWRIYDFIEDCGFDIIQQFIGKQIHLTDLDKNGEPEIWIMYRNQCTSDLSPATTKLIMYEGKTKYAFRGVDKVKSSPSGYTGGTYTMDKQWLSGNNAFLQYAKDYWTKHITRN